MAAVRSELNFNGPLHMAILIGVLIATLAALCATVRRCSSTTSSIQDQTAAAIAIVALLRQVLVKRKATYQGARRRASSRRMHLSTALRR